MRYRTQIAVALSIAVSCTSFAIGDSTDQAGTNQNDWQPSQTEVAPTPPTMVRTPILAKFRKTALRQTEPNPATQEDQEIPDAPATVDASAAQPALSVPDHPGNGECDQCQKNCSKKCNLGCEKKLFGTHCSGLEMGGWTSIGYHNRDNILANNRSGEANVHQVWFYLDMPNTDQRTLGYHIDLLYGTDAQDLQAFGNSPTGAPSGWDNSWDNGAYGWAIPQAYIQFEYNCWDVKAGKFFSPFGYEVIGAKDNFFYSHSYTMYNSEPFTMTGVLAEKKVSHNRSVIFGATGGWDTGFNRTDNGFNVITGTRYQPHEYIDLSLTSSLGDTGFRDSGTMTSGVAKLKLTSDVDYVFQADILDLGDNQEFGVVQYLFKEINPCVKVGTRLEWWKSDQFFTDTKSTWEWTVGANLRPNANVVIRPELRIDWGAAAIDPGAAIFGIDAIMTF